MSGTRGPYFVLALVGAILLGAGTAYWLEHAERRGARSSAPGAPREAAAEELREPLAEAATPARAATPPGEAREAGAGRAPVPPELPLGELSGRVQNAAGRPLAGARVSLLHSLARELEVLDLALERAVPVQEARSAPDGSFRFALARGMPVDVLAALEGYCDALEPDAYAGQELELVLAPGLLVHGTITRRRDGSPVAGAEVRVFPLGGPASLERHAESRADGHYELRIPFREGAQLEVLSAELAGSGWIELEVGPGERCRRDVALEDGRLVTGRVTASDTALPLAGATVGEGPWFRRSTTTDARGEYRLPGFGDPLVRELAARARGYAAARSGRPPAEVDGGLRLDFVLHPARSVRGRVVDEAGAPLPGATVGAVASELGDGGLRTEWLSTRTDAAGRYRLEDLTRDLGHALLVVARGYGTQVHDFPESEPGTAELELPDVVLRRPALLAGRIEDPSGVALAGVEVVLSGWNHDRYRFAREPTARAGATLDERKVRSDSRGRFWFGDLAAGRYQLVTRVAGRPESAPLVLEVVTGERREDLVLRLDTGGTIRGQVLDERGKALAGVYVSAQGERLHDAAARPVGHVHVRTDADGRFEILGLPAGEYTLRAYPLETPSPAPDEPWLSATVEHVATGSQPVQIELPRGARIRGRLLAADGSPLPGHVVATVSGARGSEEFALTDAEGSFALDVPRGSTTTLEVRGAPQSAAFRTVFLRREGVSAGTHDLLLRLLE